MARLTSANDDVENTNEPLYDRGGFVNPVGQVLPALYVPDGELEAVLVIDAAQQRVFIGSIGPNVPHSAFRGFSHSVETREATVFDRKQFERTEVTTLAALCDGIATEAWHYCAQTGRLYTTIEIDGHTDVMEVADVGQFAVTSYSGQRYS